MVNKFDRLFESDLGKKIYSTIEKTVSEHNMLDMIKSGVLVGLSGGADSVMLLAYLCELKKSIGDFPIFAVHVNHMIRGAEADRDECFSCNVAKELGVCFISEKANVLEIAKKEGLSIEEAARNVRYSIFTDIISSRKNICNIAVAHNATDNVETVIFNILRGSGTKGASGIPPVRQNIIRPLINVPKSDIILALESSGIKYVTDSSNLEDDYSRNYIRNQVLPLLSNVFSDPESSISRLSANLRSDDEYITLQAEEFLKGKSEILTADLAKLHKSLLYRVILKMADKYSVMLERKHLESIASLLYSDNFEISEENISIVNSYFNSNYKSFKYTTDDFNHKTMSASSANNGAKESIYNKFLFNFKSIIVICSIVIACLVFALVIIGKFFIGN
jgi:tRNA(Ile)-lysidine synthase